MLLSDRAQRFSTPCSLNRVVLPKCEEPKGLASLHNAEHSLPSCGLCKQPAAQPKLVFSPVPQKLRVEEGVGRRRLSNRFWKTVDTETFTGGHNRVRSCVCAWNQTLVFKEGRKLRQPYTYALDTLVSCPRVVTSKFLFRVVNPSRAIPTLISKPAQGR